MNDFRLNELTAHRKSNFDTEAIIMPFIQELEADFLLKVYSGIVG